MAIKMDKTSIIVCSVIGSLGLLSAILGFSAEGTKLTPYTILIVNVDDCLYPPNPAIGLGICAAIFLIVAQVTFSAVGGCCGCCRSRSIPSETKRIVGIVCAAFSWIAALIAFALFIEGAAWNANVVREDEAPYCRYLEDGVFAGAAVLALAASALGITSFIVQRTQPAAGDAAAPVAAPAPAPLAAGKPQNDYPVKPQGYEQPQVLPPFAPLAAAQDNASDAASHQDPSAAAAAPAVVVAATAVSEPSVLQPALGAVAIGQPLPQVPYSIPIIPIGGVDISGGAVPSSSSPSPAAGSGSGSSTLSKTILNEAARQGVKFVADVVRHSVLPDNNNGNTVGDAVVSLMTGSAGDEDASA